MGICISHEPHHIEMPTRAKNCSLLYRPLDTSPYINLHHSSTISGKAPHFSTSHSIVAKDSLDSLHINQTTKEMLKLDYIDEHVWRNHNPYCELFQSDPQGRYVTEELINYELNSLKVQMAKSQAIIAALTNTPLTDDWCWPLSEINSYHSSQKIKKTQTSNKRNSIVEITEPLTNNLSDKNQSRLPYFFMPHSQTQSFDQNPGQIRSTNTSGINRSRSCPNLSLVLQKLSTRNLSFKEIKTKFELVRDSSQESDSSRKRSWSYLAAIEQGSQQPESQATEEIYSIDCLKHSNRKLTTLPEDDLENIGKIPLADAGPASIKKEMAEPPPYRSPPKNFTICSSKIDSTAEDEKSTDTQINKSNPPTAITCQPITNAKGAVSEIAFQRRAGFSFRRRPGHTGAAPVVVNAPPTIRRSSAIELVDETSSVTETQSYAIGKQPGHNLQSSTHGHQQLSVEMETSETESAKGSMESEYDLPAASNQITQSAANAAEKFEKCMENEELMEQLAQININSPSLLSLNNLSEEEVENQFQQLFLAFNNSKATVKKRLEAHQRQRDLAETNLNKEIDQLKAMMKTAISVSQNGSNQQKKQITTSLQQQIDVLHQLVQRLSARAEIYGATEQEEKMCKATEVMMQYVCNTKKKETKLQKELDETIKVMDRAAALGLGNHAKAILSHRESSASMSSPNLGRRRASLCVVPRVPSAASGAVASAHHLPLACTCRQTMEEGDQLLKTKLRCPLHCASLNNKRRSVSVFNALPNSIINEIKRDSSRSNTSDSVSENKEAVEGTINDLQKTKLQSEDAKEMLWTTTSVDTSEQLSLRSVAINENVDEERDNSESCMDDDLVNNDENFPFDSESSDESQCESQELTSEHVKCELEYKANAWMELVTLLKRSKVKRRSESFHDFVLWWKKSSDSVELVRRVMGGFLVTLAVAFLVLGFIRPLEV